MSRPVIILGMHRSGTSCLTGSLEEAGLHLGAVNEKSRCNEKGTRENLAFMELNDEVLASQNAAWDNPPTERIHWRRDHKVWCKHLIEATAHKRIWGFKDPRTIFTLDGWLEVMPDVRLVATFRDPFAVAQSLSKRNGFSTQKGLDLWRAYNQRLLSICNEYDVSVINYDWSPSRYRAGLDAVCAAVELDRPERGFTFFETQLRKNASVRHTDLPPPLRTIHRRLRWEARRTMRTMQRSAHPKSRAPASLKGAVGASEENGTVQDEKRLNEMLHAHSVRLFPKNTGANKYRISGVASRCDWVLLSDRFEPHIELRRQTDRRAPRHIFLSLRNPFHALEYFAEEVLPQLTSSFVLVSGSEDITLPDQMDKRWPAFNARQRSAIARIVHHPLLKRWFAENLVDRSHPRFEPLPTGLVFEDNDAPPAIPIPMPPPLCDRPLRILCGHRMRAASQWKVRKSVTAIAQKEWAEWCTVLESEVSTEEYLHQISQHAFVLCVEGGGVDPSPKAWQAILYGAIPIIRRNALSSAYEQLPVAFVERWAAGEITREKLSAWRREIAPAHDNPASRRDILNRLSLDYWWAKIQAAMR